jgi:ribosome assembly protein 4
MTTILPPPSKRQRLDASERSRQQQDINDDIPADAGTMQIQLVDEITGLPIGGPMLIPVANATPKSLEMLVNKLRNTVSDKNLTLYARSPSN